MSVKDWVNAIVDDDTKEWNALPKEERLKNAKYSRAQQILTIWQMINKDKDLITARWRQKQIEWLKNCCLSYIHDFKLEV